MKPVSSSYETEATNLRRAASSRSTIGAGGAILRKIIGGPGARAMMNAGGMAMRTRRGGVAVPEVVVGGFTACLFVLALAAMSAAGFEAATLDRALLVCILVQAQLTRHAIAQQNRLLTRLERIEWERIVAHKEDKS